ncbi:hypothetical protein HPB47_000603 [Ixodes persulcatus]|uniref:Uncharacterized protein n=1 Tax=Ixodes persulcatus TaxID=34615 RepID=A0AC60PR97_IXOPE|nr:hypothetical protein HPB47_000603 [Ixodes persulcatus]
MEPTGQATGNQGTDGNTMPELEDMDEVQGEVHTNNTPGNDESQSAEEKNFPPWIKILSRKQRRLQNEAYRKTLEESRRNDEQPPSGKMATGAKTRQTSKPHKRQLPPLPIEDYKAVVRPLDGLNLGAWGPDQDYRAIKLAAKLTPVETAEIKTRLQKQFQVKPYAAMPDDSCKGVISGLTSRPSSEWLTEELNARNSNYIVLNARMMGSTTSAIITFHGLRVSRLVCIDGGEFECRIYRPKKQVCTKCLGLEHREDVCPQPENQRCPKCGTEGSAMDLHESEAKCVNCRGAHPATEPRCPARQRAPYNKSRVQKYLQQQQQSRHQPRTGAGQRPQYVATPLQPGEATQAVLPEDQWPRLPTRGWVNQNPYDLLASEALDSSPTLTGPQGSATRSGSKRARSRSKASSRSRSRARSRSRRRMQQQRSAQETEIQKSRSPGPEAPKVSWTGQQPPTPSPFPAWPPSPAPRSSIGTQHSTHKQSTQHTFIESNPGATDTSFLDTLRRELRAEMQNYRDELRMNREEMQRSMEELKKSRLEPLSLSEELKREVAKQIAEARLGISKELDHMTTTLKGDMQTGMDNARRQILKENRAQLSELVRDILSAMPRHRLGVKSLKAAGHRSYALKLVPEPSPELYSGTTQWNGTVTGSERRTTWSSENATQGYRRKRGALTQFLATLDEKPEVIAMQETACTPALSGYVTCASKPEHKGVPPRNTLLIKGDLNAANPAWGYYHESVKGRKLATAIDRNQLPLLNEPDQPTRVGNSSIRDTCPDLSLARARGPCTWTNLQESLGSDHFIIEIQVPVQAHRRQKKAFRLVNWDSFRELRAQTNAEEIDEDVPLAQWVRKLHADIHRVTKTVQTTDKAPVVDPYLLHLWEARTLGTRQTWSLLKNLLDPTKTRTETNKAIVKLLHQTAHNGESALGEFLKERYITSGPTPNYRPYPHEEADHPLDQDISEYEVRGVLNGLTRNSASGKDGVTYRILRNLDDASVSALTSYFNRVWSTGLKEDILDFPGRTQTRAVLALDLRGAFDNLSHDAILEGLTRAHCGKRTYDYVRAFLTDRTATLGLGDLRSQPIKLLGRGTPQGSVLSLTLFNIAISRLPTLLGAIPNVRHALYAFDITIWTSKGSDGEIQDGLQQAVEITQTFADAARLTCAADKSELLLIRGKPCTKADEICLNLNGEKIPTVDRLRVLGLHIQSNGKASFTVQMLRRQCQQIAHLIRWAMGVEGLKKPTPLKYQNDPDVCYTDPGEYTSPREAKCIVVCDSLGRGEAMASLAAPTSIAEAEEAAIALDAAFARCVVSQRSGHILNTVNQNTLPAIQIVWTPGHTSLPGNEGANAPARGIAGRALHGEVEAPENHNMAPSNLRTEPAQLHTDLSRQEGIEWRQIQTHTFPNFYHKHLIFPYRYRATCPGCQSPEPSLFHSTWACPSPPGQDILPIPDPSFTSWEAALSSAKPEDQRMLISRAKRIAEANGALD